MENMADDFAKLLADMRARAARMQSLASTALKDDPHPEFWRYAEDLATRWSEALAADDLDWQVLGDSAKNQSANAIAPGSCSSLGAIASKATT